MKKRGWKKIAEMLEQDGIIVENIIYNATDFYISNAGKILHTERYFAGMTDKAKYERIKKLCSKLGTKRIVIRPATWCGHARVYFLREERDEELLKEIKQIFEEEAEKRARIECDEKMFDRDEVVRATYHRIAYGNYYSILKEKQRKLLNLLDELTDEDFARWQEEIVEVEE